MYQLQFTAHAVLHQAIDVSHCSLNWSLTGDLLPSIDNYSVKGIICFIVSDGKGREDRQYEAQSQIPVVILCRRSVNELVWGVMNDHICALLTASKAGGIVSDSNGNTKTGRQIKELFKENSPLNKKWSCLTYLDRFHAADKLEAAEITHKLEPWHCCLFQALGEIFEGFHSEFSLFV